jgi:hypothetical protein
VLGVSALFLCLKSLYRFGGAVIGVFPWFEGRVPFYFVPLVVPRPVEGRVSPALWAYPELVRVGVRVFVAIPYASRKTGWVVGPEAAFAVDQPLIIFVTVLA